jgi:hypothetical protein
LLLKIATLRVKTLSKCPKANIATMLKNRCLRRDVPKMTVAQLIREFLEDPETASLRYFNSLSFLLAWWTGQ